VKVYHQSSFDRWPFEDNSIQAIITSPPYYSLRKYDIPDIEIGDWKGQYGLEPTYKLYIEHTLLWAKEAWRVLRDDGIFFLNIGDSWNGGNRGAGMSPEQWSDKQKSNTGTMSWNVPLREKNVPSKCKLLIPHRVAIGLIEQGWILRNDIVWSKPNAMPESVRDRFSKKFEYIFMLSKTGKYYFDLDGVAIEHSPNSYTREKGIYTGDKAKEEKSYISNQAARNWSDKLLAGELKGKNPGDIWTINTQPSPEKHYAMWPESLVERMILCSTKAGDSVLDPFCGSACTLRVADKLNRVAYGIDLGYGDIQERRLSNIQKVLL
jgi:site-specific DNA-methyltransferase (cytosine-N4-specific)